MNSEINIKKTSYSKFIIGWIFLLALTSVTIIISGMNLGEYALFITLTLAIIQSVIIINTFMKIKLNELIVKVFLIISVISLSVILFSTSFK